MANYTVEQACKMIDDCFTPEYLMMEKAIERQHYIDIFTEMHNYISENIVELPFDAEVFTEEEETKTKSVWDKNDKGWDGFWRNVGRVLKNIWNKFWGFIKSLVSLSDEVKPQEAKKIADNAEAVAKDLEQKSEQEVEKAAEEKPEEVKSAAQEVKAVTVSLIDGITKMKEITEKRDKNRDQANKDFKDDKLKSELKSIDATALQEIEQLLKSTAVDLDKIITNPEEFRGNRGNLIIFLKLVADSIKPEKIDLMNKAKNYLRSTNICALLGVKLLYDIINLYPKQSDTIKSTIQQMLTAKSIKPTIISLDDGIQALNDFETNKLAAKSKLVTAFIQAGSKATKKTPAVPASIDESKLNSVITKAQKDINDAKSTISKALSAMNITSLKADDYFVNIDSSTGQAQISDIPQLSEAIPVEELKQKNPSLQKNMSTIVQLVAEATSLLIRTKGTSDRKLYGNINNAINKLASL